MADISALTSEELIRELRKHGLNVGPITSTTRKLFEKKLARARGQKIQKLECEEICAISPIEEKRSDVDRSSICNVNISNSSSNNSTNFHYGVSFNRSNNDGSFNTQPAVFNSQHQALQAVKQLKDKEARFKPFKTREEAEKFSLSSLTCTPSSLVPLQKSSDPVGNFKKPSPQELIKFRKIIESGNFQDFLSVVNANPKYLISSGDTPVLLQEGFRYNAMHIAAKENKPGICKLIIDTVESDMFWIYYLSLNKDDKLSPMSFKRKRYLADLYLNTPDKGNFETPLHFACKFGHVEVVKYLVSHPLTNTSPRNKYNETPEQIICSRCSSQSGSVKLIEELKHVLEDNHYVPVFGSEDDASPPSIGEPWSPDIHTRDYRPSSQSPVRSPVDPKMTVRAYAGPMSPSKAAEFHRQWKTPPGSIEEKRKLRDIRRGDSTRGLERIGRSLAHKHNIPWAEYWNFLGAYIDLAQPSGLERLEEYFREHLSKLEICEQDDQHILATPVMPNRYPIRQDCNGFSTPERTLSDNGSVFTNESASDCGSVHGSPSLRPVYNDSNSAMVSNTIDTTCKLFGQLSIEPGKLLPSSLSLQESNQVIAKQLDYRKTQESIDKSAGTDTQTVSPTNRDFQGHARSKSESDENELFLCKTNLLDQLKAMNLQDDEEVQVESGDENERGKERQQKKDKLYEQEQPQQLHQQQKQGKQQQEQQVHMLPKQQENVHNSLESMKKISNEKKSSTDSTDSVISRRETVTLFMNGCYPSKTDLDVLRALEGVSLSYDSYPLITQWRDRVMSYASSTRESWPSPGSPLCRSRSKHRFPTTS